MFCCKSWAEKKKRFTAFETMGSEHKTITAQEHKKICNSAMFKEKEGRESVSLVCEENIHTYIHK